MTDSLSTRHPSDAEHPDAGYPGAGHPDAGYPGGGMAVPDGGHPGDGDLESGASKTGIREDGDVPHDTPTRHGIVLRLLLMGACFLIGWLATVENASPNTARQPQPDIFTEISHGL